MAKLLDRTNKECPIESFESTSTTSKNVGPTPITDKKELALFASSLGLLLWLVMTTRFELANITSKIGSFASKPTYGALQTVFNCISYLRGVQYQVLQVSIHVEHDMVEMMCDADWATLDVGLAKRTSTLGVILLLNGAPVAWKATKHV